MLHNLPKIGLRNIKTALSVLICILFFKFTKDSSPFYACIAAVICLKETIENTLSMGKNRLIGTFLGGLFGTVIVFTLPIINISNNFYPFITALGVMCIIYICTIIEKPGSVTIACIVFIGIMLSYTGIESYHYAITRTIDTAIGVVVAILVNKYFNPNFLIPKEDI